MPAAFFEKIRAKISRNKYNKREKISHIERKRRIEQKTWMKRQFLRNFCRNSTLWHLKKNRYYYMIKKVTGFTGSSAFWADAEYSGKNTAQDGAENIGGRYDRY